MSLEAIASDYGFAGRTTLPKRVIDAPPAAAQSEWEQLSKTTLPRAVKVAAG